MEDKNKYKAQEEYQKRVGLISKSYKLPSSLVNDFAETCQKTGTTQASELKMFMEKFIKENQ